MTFLTLDGLGSAEEPTTQPEGVYEVSILSADTKQSPKDPDITWINVRMEILDNPTAADIYLPLWLPAKKDTDKQVIRKLSRVKKFCSCFGVNFEEDGLELESLLGAVGNVLLKEEEDEYGRKNTVNKFIDP